MSAEPLDTVFARLSAAETQPPQQRPGPRTVQVPRQLARLEPVVCLGLAVHGLAVQLVVSAGWGSPIGASAVILIVMGLAGVLGWRGPVAVIARAGTVLVLGYLLQALLEQGSGYFLLWYFVIVAVYPLVLPRQLGRWVAVAVPGAFLLLLPLGAADGPAPVALVRALSLAMIAVFVHLAALDYRAAVSERDDAITLLDTFADSTPVGLGFWDLDLRCRRVNETFARMTGLAAPSVVGQRASDVLEVPSALAVNLHRVLESGQPIEDVELTSEDHVWTSSYFPVRTGGELVGVGAVVIDISEQHEAVRALAHSATHDSLTGLPNRVLFTDRLGMALATAERVGGLVAVMFCDIDRFKVINDSLGHGAGDEILREAAVRLEKMMPTGDTVARLGGDEFAVLCTDVVDIEEAKAVAELACTVVREPMHIRDRLVTSTMSVGVTICHPGERDVAGLLRDADVAMYQAKDAGRDRIALFDAGLRSSVTERFEFHGALRRAVEHGEITVAYQPVLELDRNGLDPCPGPESIIGVEALARWRRPGHGEVPPGVFIPMAEDLGLIHALGEQVLRTACATVLSWREQTGRPLTVAVNLSARQLAEDSCVDDVAAVLAQVGLPASALQLEITESVLMVDVVHSLDQITALHALGVTIAVDDFGTGYSSLAYLRDMPVDVLKIDQSFTSRLPSDEAMFAFIVALARATGSTTVVEGVETRAQLDQVTRVGCDKAQGYYLSRPLTAEGATDYLRVLGTVPIV